MFNFKTLSTRGRSVAKARGHDMSRLSKTRLWANRPVWSAQCVKCHAFLSINTNPAPNEIDISGDSVATNCKG